MNVFKNIAGMTTALTMGVASGLSGCAGTSTTAVSDFITQVQTDAKVACAVIPSATAIAALAGLNDTALTTATQIADAICLAVAAVAVAPATVSMKFVRDWSVPKTHLRKVPMPITVHGVTVSFI